MHDSLPLSHSLALSRSLSISFSLSLSMCTYLHIKIRIPSPHTHMYIYIYIHVHIHNIQCRWTLTSHFITLHACIFRSIAVHDITLHYIRASINFIPDSQKWLLNSPRGFRQRLTRPCAKVSAAFFVSSPSSIWSVVSVRPPGSMRRRTAKAKAAACGPRSCCFCWPQVWCNRLGKPCHGRHLRPPCWCEILKWKDTFGVGTGYFNVKNQCPRMSWGLGP